MVLPIKKATVKHEKRSTKAAVKRAIPQSMKASMKNITQSMKAAMNNIPQVMKAAMKNIPQSTKPLATCDCCCDCGKNDGGWQVHGWHGDDTTDGGWHNGRNDGGVTATKQAKQGTTTSGTRGDQQTTFDAETRSSPSSPEAEYPWHADDLCDPRRWELRIDQDGNAYRYAELYWYYGDTYTKREIDYYWNQLPVATPTSGWSPPGCGSPEWMCFERHRTPVLLASWEATHRWSM